MSFKYDELNLAVLDDAKALFAKPSTSWTANEHKRAVLIIEALRIVANQYRKPAMPVFKNPTCRGSYLLGSACGHCERCEWERSGS